MQAVEDKVRSELVKAEDDNLKIYMDVIPDPSTLPPLIGKLLVNSKVPEYLTKGPEKWFADIVPDRVAKALSKYTEEMDSTVRGMLQKLEDASDEARVTLVQYNLPGALESLNQERKTDIPEDLKLAFMDEFVTHGGAQHLQVTNTSALITSCIEGHAFRIMHSGTFPRTLNLSFEIN